MSQPAMSQPETRESFEILMVCLGNICRSPMMERLLRAGLVETLAREDAARFRIGGSGTYAEVGRPIHPPAARALTEVGVDPSSFVARQFSSGQARSADLVLTATTDLRDQIVGMCPDVAERTFSLKEFAKLLLGLGPGMWAEDRAVLASPDPVARARSLVAAAHQARKGGSVRLLRRSAHLDVADPYGASDSTYRACRDEIAAALFPLVQALTARLPEAPMTTATESS